MFIHKALHLRTCRTVFAALFHYAVLTYCNAVLLSAATKLFYSTAKCRVYTDRITIRLDDTPLLYLATLRLFGFYVAFAPSSPLASLPHRFFYCVRTHAQKIFLGRPMLYSATYSGVKTPSIYIRALETLTFYAFYLRRSEVYGNLLWKQC